MYFACTDGAPNPSSGNVLEDCFPENVLRESLFFRCSGNPIILRMGVLTGGDALSYLSANDDCSD